MSLSDAARDWFAQLRDIGEALQVPRARESRVADATRAILTRHPRRREPLRSDATPYPSIDERPIALPEGDAAPMPIAPIETRQAAWDRPSPAEPSPWTTGGRVAGFERQCANFPAAGSPTEPDAPDAYPVAAIEAAPELERQSPKRRRRRHCRYCQAKWGWR